MAKRKKISRQQIPPLEPLIYNEDLSPFELCHYIDVVDTKLELNDYDWMNYKLSTRMITKEYGELIIEFIYYGCGPCIMNVENENVIYSFEFSTAIFQEHIVRYIKKHIKSWGERHVDNGAEEVIYFYNDVLTSPHTKEGVRQVIRRRKNKE